MKFMYKLEQKFGRYAIRNISLILVLCYVAGYMIEVINPSFLYYLTLDPYAIIHGQVWRIVSWILIPPTESNIFFAIIMLMFYYSIGTALERTWGTFQYNLYLFSGMFFTLLGSFLLLALGYIFHSGAIQIAGAEFYFRKLSAFFSTYYVNMSIFFAYAVTFPDNQVLLMFIIPVKVKWMGVVYGAFLIYEMISGASVYGYVVPVVIGASLLNFLVFFFTTRNYIRMNRTQRKMHRAYKKHVSSFEKEKKMAGVPKHKCAVCGRTEKDGDDLQFRFCSKCQGNYEYCQDHLYTHIHFTK